MRWLRKTCIALGRWWLRQATALVVIGFGMFLGWWIRKGTGPSLVSESFSRTKPSAPGPPRPGPLTARDPAVAAYLAEFASLDRPSGTLLRLQSDLERGRITDFESLAKSLLSHPLPHFREEAMRAVLRAWGRKDPGGALRFLDDYGKEYVSAQLDQGIDPAKLDLAGRWAGQDPAAALDYLVRTRGIAGVNEELVRAILFSEGPVLDRLRLLTGTLGETRVAASVVGSPLRHGSEPSSAQWRALAGETRNYQLAAAYVSQALVTKWYEESCWVKARSHPPADEVRAWMTEFVPDALRSQIKWQSMPPRVFATLLPALSAEDLQVGNGASALVELHREKAGDVFGFFQHNGSSWMPAPAFRALGALIERRPEAEWTAAVAAATEPAQREELGLGLVSSALRDRGIGLELGTLVDKLAGLGREGEPAMSSLLGHANSRTVQQVPAVFAQQSAEFQAEKRMEVAVQLARESSPTAAELWLGASPEELMQPGAVAVTEEIAARFLRRDSEAASEWIGRLAPGLGRDRAVARMIELTAERDPETCSQWAATIQDPAAMERATHALGSLGRRPSSNQ